MWKLLAPFIVLLAAVGLSVLSDKPQPPADIVFINDGDVNTLDVTRMSWLQDFRVAGAVWEGLVINNVFSRDFDKMPGVAERWERSADQRTYTFHLRPNAKWSDGSQVTAEDFRFAWRRALLPDSVGDYVSMFQMIEGGQAFYDWRQARLDEFAKVHAPADRAAAARELWAQTQKKFDELVRCEAPDPLTLVVRLERSVPYFIDCVAFEAFFPLHRGLLARYTSISPETGRVETDSGWTRPPALIGNGKFKLTTWRFKRDMRLERNEHHWDQLAINVDSIKMPSIGDPNAQILSYRTGGADWLSSVVPNYRADLIAAKKQYISEHQELYDQLKEQGFDQVAIDRRMPPDPRQNIHVFPAFGTYFYSFNCRPNLPDGRPNPFHDAKVRKAFSISVEKSIIAENVRRIGEAVADVLVPPNSIAGYPPVYGAAYDPAEARRLLAEAGYPNGEGFITVSILYNKDSGHDLIAQAIAKSWQTNLGVKVTLDQKEIKVFRQDLKSSNYMIARGGWFGDYGDPTTFLDLSKTNDGNNDRKYSNPVFDSLLDRAANELDPIKRMGVLAEAERMLVQDEFPMLPIFHYGLVHMFNPHKVSGVSPHPRQKQHIQLLDMLGDGKGRDAPLEIPPPPPTRKW